MRVRQASRAAVAVLLASALFPGVAAAAPIAKVIYVNAAATGANSGASWTDAYTSLQTALGAAVSGDQIWVAGGTYRPTTGTDRTASFNPKVGVAVYGGFAGTETAVSQRAMAAHPTTLSGDIGVAGDSSDNSYHVIFDQLTGDPTAVFDGFRITGGFANQGLGYDVGAGVYEFQGSTTFRNLVVSGNVASLGAGMFVALSSSALSNITVSDNTATAGLGGGMWVGGWASSSWHTTLSNVTVTGNTAANAGAGIIVEGEGTVTLTNVTIAGNVGSGIATNAGGHAVLRNSIIWGNSGGPTSNGLNPTLIRSLVEGGCPLGASCTDVLNQNPDLLPLAPRGAFVPTMAPGVDSVAIDTGEDGTCPSGDARGTRRPQGTHCDMGAMEVPVIAFRSQPAYDGWLLESTETGGAGGSLNTTASTIRVGDDALDRQYRGFVSFNTATLANNATIVRTVLSLRQSSVTGTNPFSSYSGMRADIRTPYFGSGLSLVLSDFRALPSVSSAGLFGPNASGGWYRVQLSMASLKYVSRTSTTQLRVRFTKDDNDDRSADYISFVSGNGTTSASRPLLWVYVLP